MFGLGPEFWFWMMIASWVLLSDVLFYAKIKALSDRVEIIREILDEEVE